jgi:hypothetical protein
MKLYFYPLECPIQKTGQQRISIKDASMKVREYSHAYPPIDCAGKQISASEPLHHDSKETEIKPVKGMRYNSGFSLKYNLSRTLQQFFFSL